MTKKNNSILATYTPSIVSPTINHYAYIRVSTETQADKGYGLETQKTAIKQYCNENNINLPDSHIFVDAGKSGTIGDKDTLESRPSITKLLYANILKENDIVIVMNTSRLWRDDGARVLISMAVKKIRGEIISIEQPRYSLYNANPQDFFFNSMMETLDQYERMCINLRLANGRKTKAKQGYKPCGIIPYGYLCNNDRIIEIEFNESNIVKEIFKLASNGLSAYAITNILNDQGMYGRKAQPWKRQTISYMIKNKYYAGILIYDGEEIKGKHKPIISTELFSHVQTLLNSSNT